jgi:hypothetical protein
MKCEENKIKAAFIKFSITNNVGDISTCLCTQVLRNEVNSMLFVPQKDLISP